MVRRKYALAGTFEHWPWPGRHTPDWDELRRRYGRGGWYEVRDAQSPTYGRAERFLSDSPAVVFENPRPAPAPMPSAGVPMVPPELGGALQRLMDEREREIARLRDELSVAQVGGSDKLGATREAYELYKELHVIFGARGVDPPAAQNPPEPERQGIMAMVFDVLEHTDELGKLMNFGAEAWARKQAGADWTKVARAASSVGLTAQDVLGWVADYAAEQAKEDDD